MLLMKCFIFFPIIAMRTEILLRKKIPSTYHQYHSVYGYQACQGGELPWLVPTHKVNQTFGHARSLYLHYHSAYGFQIWQDSDLSGWTPTHKVIRPLDQVVLQDHVTN